MKTQHRFLKIQPVKLSGKKVAAVQANYYIADYLRVVLSCLFPDR